MIAALTAAALYAHCLRADEVCHQQMMAAFVVARGETLDPAAARIDAEIEAANPNARPHVCGDLPDRFTLARWYVSQWRVYPTHSRDAETQANNAVYGNVRMCR